MKAADRGTAGRPRRILVAMTAHRLAVLALGLSIAAPALPQVDPPSGANPPRPKVTLPPLEPRPRNLTTLQMDPERPEPIVAWWSNGTQILELREDGSYRLWKTDGRHREPDEIGRWDRQNHATFWLDPYSRRKEERSRCSLSIVEGEVVTTLRTYAPLARLEGPPPAPEDALVGLWVGDGGSLELREGGRYRLVAPRIDGTPVAIAGHEGTWRLEGPRLVLTPRSPSVAAVTMQIEAAKPDPSRAGKPGPPRLRSVEGTLEKVEPKALTPPTAPADEAR